MAKKLTTPTTNKRSGRKRTKSVEDGTIGGPLEGTQQDVQGNSGGDGSPVGQSIYANVEFKYADWAEQNFNTFIQLVDVKLAQLKYELLKYAQEKRHIVQ